MHYEAEMINNKIIEIRQKNKLSQAEFAKILNVSKDRVGRIERGQHKNIDLNLLLTLAENFDINIHWLITGQEPGASQSCKTSGNHSAFHEGQECAAQLICGPQRSYVFL